MGAISKSMNDLIQERLVLVMNQYNSYRQSLAKQGLDGVNIKSDLEYEPVWENKIKQLKGLLKGKEVLFPAKQKKEIALGTVVTLAFSDGYRKEVIIDGVRFIDQKLPFETISCESKVGASLMEKRKGDKITVGDKTIEVVKIHYPW
jgi:transcription elongation GreA/GreB family factor